jgi:hypothetical protein
VEASSGNTNAGKILHLRKDVNFLLTTILWGNVGINVLLTLLADSVLAGVSAFVFSTVLITFLGEIAPQAYFSRNAMRMGGLLAPLLRLYQYLLYPVAKPTAWVLDQWLGRENIQYFRERDLRTVIRKHIEADETDLARLEGIGAMNFLALDDLLVSQEGEPVDPQSIIRLPIQDGQPVFPTFRQEATDPFLRQVSASGKKWIIITNAVDGEPELVLNAHAFLRDAIFSTGPVHALNYCHLPVIARNVNTLLGKVLLRLRVDASGSQKDIIDRDLILVWSDEKRIITGADILGRLMQGIVLRA